MAIARMLTTAVLVFAALLSTACTPRQAKVPQIRILTDQEAIDLWNRAESREPVGEPVVQEFKKDTKDEKCTEVITTQVYMLRMPGGGSNGLGISCGGNCIATGDGTPADCKTSGCFHKGGSCTPLVCSGKCTVSKACKVERSTLVMY